MTWRLTSSRHPDPKAKAAQQGRCSEAVHALAAACQQRDAALISRLLTPDVDLLIDSGGTVPNLPHRAEGSSASSTLTLQILARHTHLTVDEHPVNGAPAILLRDGGILVGVISVGMQHDAISHVWVVLNPDKLIRFDMD